MQIGEFVNNQNFSGNVFQNSSLLVKIRWRMKRFRMDLNPRPVLFVEAVQKATSGADKKVLANELAYFVKCKSNVDVVCGQVKVNRKSLVSLYCHKSKPEMFTNPH